MVGHIRKQDMDILEFQGKYRWLSNFWPTQVVLDGQIFPSVENAYQAAKTNPLQRAQFRYCTAWQAKRLGRTVEIRADWEQEKVPTMRALLAQKFSQGSELGEKLKETGDCQIIEGNYWGDVFWGVCKGRGQNWLGKLIMEQRTILQNTEIKMIK
jgi:ribA/ribD-fused uncharacterized protein